MTALTVIQNACPRLGITAPTAVFGSTDDQTIQLRNLMNQEGINLSKGGDTDHAWQALTVQQTFTSVAATIQTGAVPSDFGFFINDTMWNRTTRIKMTGPVGAEEWQTYQAIAIIALPNAVFRFRGNDLLVYPTPVAGGTVAYEYVSKNWALSSSSVAKAAMTADDDTSRIDEELLTIGVIWRFLAAKGLDYGETFRTYQLAVTKAVARDGGRRKLNLAGSIQNRFQGNIPEGSWP